MLTVTKTVTNLKEVTHVIPTLSYPDVASLLFAVAESIRQGQSLESSLETLGVIIQGVTDDGSYLLPNIRDVDEEQELIAIASACTAHLMQAYRCI